MSEGSFELPHGRGIRGRDAAPNIFSGQGHWSYVILLACEIQQLEHDNGSP